MNLDKYREREPRKVENKIREYRFMRDKSRQSLKKNYVLNTVKK